MSSTMIILSIIAFILIAFLIVHLLFHSYKWGTVNLITGAPKTGKSLLCVYKGISSHRLRLIKYLMFLPTEYLLNYIFKKQNKYEPPLIYCNIPIKSKYYAPITKDILQRKKRLVFGSVVIWDESSLIINSMCYDNKTLNEQVELFIKLFGHETHGGVLFTNTQALNDNHYNVKRCIDRNTWIERTIKIPFFVIFRVRSLMVCDENTINVNATSPDDNCKSIFVPKSYFKKYDRYSFSYLTDNLPVENKYYDTTKLKDMKAYNIISFRKFLTINKEDEKNEK